MSGHIKLAGCVVASTLFVLVGFVWLRRKRKDTGSDPVEEDYKTSKPNKQDTPSKTKSEDPVKTKQAEPVTPKTEEAIKLQKQVIEELSETQEEVTTLEWDRNLVHELGLGEKPGENAEEAIANCIIKKCREPLSQIEEEPVHVEDALVEELTAVDSAILEARVLPNQGEGDAGLPDPKKIADFFATLNGCSDRLGGLVKECAEELVIEESVKSEESCLSWAAQAEQEEEAEIVVKKAESGTLQTVAEESETNDSSNNTDENNGTASSPDRMDGNDCIASSPDPASNGSDLPSTLSKTPSECSSSESGRGFDGIMTGRELPVACRFYFELPKKYSGRLIGSRGCFVNLVKQKTQTSITVKSHPALPSYSLVEIVGTEKQIEKSLRLIRKKFPENKFPTVTLKPVVLAPNESIPPPMTQLSLTIGAPVEVLLSAFVSPGHVFLHQPTHPSYYKHIHNQQKIQEFYLQGDAPDTVRPIMPNNICVAPVLGTWFRAEVQQVFPDVDQCVIKLLDFGGYYTVEMATLKQIWGDFISLPFQATECYLSNIVPSDETQGWTEEAHTYFGSITKNHVLYAEVTSYSEDGLPNILLHEGSYSDSAMMFHSGPEANCINRLLTVAGHARWIP